MIFFSSFINLLFVSFPLFLSLRFLTLFIVLRWNWNKMWASLRASFTYGIYPTKRQRRRSYSSGYPSGESPTCSYSKGKIRWETTLYLVYINIYSEFVKGVLLRVSVHLEILKEVRKKLPRMCCTVLLHWIYLVVCCVIRSLVAHGV